MTEPTHCPDHGDADDEWRAWMCPDECPHFLDELERRIVDVKIHGNFVRMWKDDDGQSWKQRFRNHVPDGEPIPATW